MKIRIFTLLAFAIAFFASSPGRAQNILSDGNFSTTTNIPQYYSGVAPANIWSTFLGYTSEVTITVDEGVCYFDIKKGSIYNWDVTLAQGGFPLNPGHSYTLTFDVKADADRTFGVYLGPDGEPWISLIGYDRYTYTATTEWQTIFIDFKATCVFPYHKLSFEMGTITTGMYFDNVNLQEIGRAHV